MTHYDTLGVAPDASPEDIKRGYRRAAARAHPDKDGGDTEQMAKVNKAYEVLSDPQLRAHYDATGEDGQQAQGADAHTAVLMQVFRQAIDECDGDILAYCTQQLQAGKDQMNAREIRAKATVAKLTKKRDRLRRKAGGDNLFTALIDAKVREAQGEVELAARVREQFDGALDLLKDYESTFVPEQQPQRSAPNTASEILSRIEEMDRMFRAHSPFGTRQGRY